MSLPSLMRRLPDQEAFPLYGVAATRQMESALAGSQPPHELMARAGLALAQLTLALHPHARTLWVACGPGNNGGDALVAALHLAQWRRQTGAGPVVFISRCPGGQAPMDTTWALAQLEAAGLPIHTSPPDEWDVAIDGLLGIGVRQAPAGLLATHWSALFGADRPVVCVDVPSGLNADTGQWLMPEGFVLQPCRAPRHTLTMLTAKPGLFTADGRDAAGQVWLAPLGPDLPPSDLPDAWLGAASSLPPLRMHASHKGSQGDVMVIGGQGMGSTGIGMTGAGVLAARTALLAGAGRVYLGLLGGPEGNPAWDPLQPELMLRTPEQLVTPPMLETAVTVCGCGGGKAVARWLPSILAHARRLVLDADALNELAADSDGLHRLRWRASQGWLTVLTPHPLEAARLLGCTSTGIQRDRLAAARRLAAETGAICVLKGSGTIVAAPDTTPVINATGNPALATAGTGDVLAGLVGSMLAQPGSDGAASFRTVARAVMLHGLAADRLACQPPGQPITASSLAQALGSGPWRTQVSSMSPT
ncbi:MAG: NAD(P)H-hydrate dehydratase [Gammaproteobacteria bacterium]